MANFSALVKAQANAVGGVYRLLGSRLLAIWLGARFYDPGAVASAIFESVSLVELAQGQARKQSVAYQKGVFRALGLDMPDGTLPGFPDYPRRLVTPEEVWERPVKLYRRSVADGDSHDVALGKVADRVRSMAREEVQLAQRDQSARVYERAPRVTGYRRVVHPELSRTGVCGLCLVAATRVYRKSELMPIHTNCLCTTLPVTAGSDPGLDLNQSDLEEIYAKAGSTSAADLSALRVQSYVSGELGPVLTRGGTVVADGSTRPKRLAPREEANKVTGVAASRGAKPKSGAEQREYLEKRVSAMSRMLEGLSGTQGEHSLQARMAREHLERLQARLDGVSV